jgi:hypothetical protein
VRHGLLVTLVHSLLHAVREKAGAGWAARWGDGPEEIGQKRIREGGGVGPQWNFGPWPISEENPYSIF